MTLSAADIGLYAFALFILFLTPGPVWIAMLARALSGGFRSVWPLALGVVVGDVLWPFFAILGMSWILAEVEGILLVLRWVAVIMFLGMGILLIKKADAPIGSDSRLTKPGMWAGFVAGLVVILGNPKAILFYMGLLPGFFDLTALTTRDIVVICLVSACVPFVGNLLLGLFVGKIRSFLASKGATKRLNTVAGLLLIAVAFVIPFT